MRPILYVGSGHFLGFKILNCDIWLFRKINIFLGMKILWIFFIFFWGGGGGVITKLDYRGYVYAF